jgi:IS1 family transposase
MYLSEVYAGQHQAVADKSQTYAVEGDNAELRPDLARLGRASHGCNFRLPSLQPIP